MEIKELNIRPSSNRRVLVQQVEKQSELCDIKVKMGQWEKRFHRCVLVASPFFEQAMKSNFKERRTGVIEISVGTPVSTEQALMFLYGKKPEMTLENIATLMESAEYLMIKTLKSSCIRWLRSLDISDENCITILQLSTVYNFEVHEITEYIESHLTSLLQNPQTVTLTKDSVGYLLSDRRLGYVSMDDKLKFLDRWCKINTRERMKSTKELVKKIDLREVNKSVLKDIINESPFNEIEDFKNALEDSPINEASSHKVLIMTDGKMKGRFWCLDLNRHYWYRIDCVSFAEMYKNIENLYPQIAGQRNSSELYFGNIRCGGRSVFCLDLTTEECKMYRIVLKNRPASEAIGHFCMNKDYAFACTYIIGSGPLINKYLLDRMALYGTFIPSTNRWVPSVIYAGSASRKSFHLTPIFALKDENVLRLCCNELSELAIITESMKNVFLYDMTDFSLVKIALDITDIDEIIPNHNGFVLYNQTRCVFISRLEGPCLSDKYLVQESRLASEKIPDIKFEFSFYGEYCFRYSVDIKKSELALHYATHDDMLTANSSNRWKRLPFPFDSENERENDEEMEKDDQTIGLETSMFSSRQHACDSFFKRRKFIVEIPKEKLKCHIDCPHCEITYTYSSDSDSDDNESDTAYEYEDSESDEENTCSCM